jgi:cell division protein FtsB
MGYHERLQARIYELEAEVAKLQDEYDELKARNERQSDALRGFQSHLNMVLINDYME